MPKTTFVVSFLSSCKWRLLNYVISAKHAQGFLIVHCEVKKGKEEVFWGFFRPPKIHSVKKSCFGLVVPCHAKKSLSLAKNNGDTDDYSRIHLDIKTGIKTRRIFNFKRTFKMYYKLNVVSQCRVLPKILSFLPNFSRQNWRVIFEVFQSNFDFAWLNSPVRSLVWENE